jgi:hypothetical protein
MAVRKTTLKEESITEVEQLIHLVWRWKFLYAAVVAVIVLSTVGWYKTRPLVYGSTVSIKVGRVANVLVEPWADMESMMKIYEDEARAKHVQYALFQSSVQRQDEARGTLIVTVLTQSLDPDLSRPYAMKIAEDIVARHKKIYDRAYAAFTKHTPSSEAQLYFIESYTSPTKIVGKAEPYSARSVSGGIENPASPGMGLKQYLVLSFFCGIFFGLLIVYCADVLSRRRS